MKKIDRRCPTGIIGLDTCIEGGLPRGASLHLKGPAHSGKTILGMQMQYAALRRGEGCLFISYCEPWQNVIRAFDSFGWDVRKYIRQGNFRILDNASKINGLDTSPESVPPDIRDGVVIIEQLDQEVYLEAQMAVIREVMSKSTRAGVNIIDSAEFRVRFLESIDKVNTEIASYFQKFRTTITSQFPLIGVHISTPISKNSSLAHTLDQIEEGTIELKMVERNDEMKRFIRVVGLPYTDCDGKWHEFRITKKGIALIPK